MVGVGRVFNNKKEDGKMKDDGNGFKVGGSKVVAQAPAKKMLAWAVLLDGKLVDVCMTREAARAVTMGGTIIRVELVPVN